MNIFIPFKKIKNIKNLNKKGFTLVETLVAITILVLAFTAPLGIVAQALRSSYFSRDQITSFYLAQEALEYVRNIRDNNSLTNLSDASQWLNNLTICSTTDGCKLDVLAVSPTQPLTACTGTCPNLNLNTATGIYSYASGNVSNFKRTVYITNLAGGQPIPGDKEVIVKCVITWNTGSLKKTYTLTENLSNWQSISAS